ncbi:MAG: hypothetical protein AAF363_14420 [Bacteroidota bacterium]
MDRAKAKRKIRALIMRFVNRRESSINQSASKRQVELNAISNIRRKLSFFEKRTLEEHYIMVWQLQGDLYVLAPGSNAVAEEMALWGRIQGMMTFSKMKRDELEGVQLRISA